MLSDYTKMNETVFLEIIAIRDWTWILVNIIQTGDRTMKNDVYSVLRYFREGKVNRKFFGGIELDFLSWILYGQYWKE